MSTTDKLNKIIDTKKRLKDAINNFSLEQITDETPFSEYPEKIKSIQDTFEEYSSEIVVTEESDNSNILELDDALNYNLMDLTIDGKSEQFTSNGRQLFDINNTVTYIYHCDMEIKDNIIKVTNTTDGNGVAYQSISLPNPEKLLGKEVTFFANYKLQNSNQYPRISFWTSLNGTWKDEICRIEEFDEPTTFTFPSEFSNGCNGFEIIFYSQGVSDVAKTIGDYIEYSNVQLEFGNKVNSWEPYTGGIQTPSPELPSEIKSIKGITNLFNKYGDFTYGNTNNRTSLQEDGTILTKSNSWDWNSSGQLFKVEPNTYYTISGTLISANGTNPTSNANIRIFNTDITRINNYEIDTNVTKPYDFIYIFNSGDNNELYISFNGSNSSSSGLTTTIFDKIEIVKGIYTSPLNIKYGEYKLLAKLTGNNLQSAQELYQRMKEYEPTFVSKIDDNGINVIKFANYMYRDDTKNKRNFNFYNNWKFNTQYTITGLFKTVDTERTGLYFVIVYTDGTVSMTNISYAPDYKRLKIVSEKNKTIERVGFSYGTAGYWLLDIDSWFIGEGDVTKYEQYKGKELLIPFDKENLFNESQLLEAHNWSLNNEGYYNGAFANLNEQFGVSTNGFSFDKSFKENTQYTISLTGYVSSNTATIRAYYSDDVFDSVYIGATSPTKYILTTRANKTVTRIVGSYYSGGSDILYIKDFKVYEGLSLEDHWELCSTSDIKDELDIDCDEVMLNKKINKKIFDGSEDWTERVNSKDIKEFVILNTIQNIKNGEQKCNYFSNYDYSTIWNFGNVGDFALTSARFVGCVNDNLSLEEFKELLKSNNLNIYFQLAEPYTISLGKIDPILLEEGYNRIELIEDIQTNISAKYIADGNKYIKRKGGV